MADAKLKAKPPEFAGIPLTDDLKSKPAESGTPARQAFDEISYKVVGRADEGMRKLLGKIIPRKTEKE